MYNSINKAIVVMSACKSINEAACSNILLCLANQQHRGWNLDIVLAVGLTCQVGQSKPSLLGLGHLPAIWEGI